MNKLDICCGALSRALGCSPPPPPLSKFMKPRYRSLTIIGYDYFRATVGCYCIFTRISMIHIGESLVIAMAQDG